MLEVYNQPAVKTRSASYIRVVNGITQAPITLPRVLFYQKTSGTIATVTIQDNFVGVEFRCQIAQSDVDFTPVTNDRLIIDNITYKIVDQVQFLDYNPAFKPFYQFNIKKIA